MKKDVPPANPHMWIPYNGPEPFDEVCDLCGVLSGGHDNRPQPPEALLPCPKPWPEDDDPDFHLRPLCGASDLDGCACWRCQCGHWNSRQRIDPKATAPCDECGNPAPNWSTE